MYSNYCQPQQEILQTQQRPKSNNLLISTNYQSANMYTGYKLNNKQKSSPSKNQFTTMHSSPNLQTQLSQFTNLLDDDIKLNEIRRMRSQQQDNQVLMQSRLNHLIKQKNMGLNKISTKQQDINNIIQTKTRVFVDKQFKIYVNKIRSNELSLQAQEIQSLRQKRYDNSNETFQYSQMQLQSQYINNKQEKENRKLQFQLTMQEIHDKNLITHSTVQGQFNSLRQYRKLSYNMKRAVSSYNYRHKVEVEKDQIQKILLNLQDMEQREQNVILELRTTQNNVRNIQEQRSYIQQGPVEQLIREQDRNYFGSQRQSV